MTQIETLILPRYISNGMIIQQNKPIVFSGLDKPTTPVKLIFGDQEMETVANKQGEWSVTFPEKTKGEPLTLFISGSKEVTISDILIGEVWLIGGQSNMELPINRTYDEFKEEIDSAHYPDIRQFHIELEPSFDQPKKLMEQGEWKEATQENIQNFSSLGFFYAKRLHEELNVPIGIIHTAVGGTPIEAWMSEETLNELGNYDEDIAYWKNPDNVKKEIEKDALISQTWYGDLQANDKGLNEEPKWFEEDIQVDDWKTLTIPVMFQDTDLDKFTGAVWFRKEFKCTEEDLSSDNYRLRLGSLINGDEAYLNGEKVGETGYRYPPRKYQFDKGILKVGKNTLVIRLSIDAANGGFIPSFPYQIESDNVTIPLEGEWLYKIGHQKEVIAPMLFLHYKPSVLYKGMLYPLKDIALKGFLFYQGESNTGQPLGYKDLMRMMVNDWRELFQDELPFYYVQLANYIDPASKVDDSQWALLRYEQDRARLDIEKSEMVPAYDCGISFELHPHDKKTLAHRLASISLERDYAIGEPHANVELKSVTRNGDKLLIEVSGVKGNLLRTEENPEIDIELNDQWVAATDYEIREEQIIVSLDYLNESDKLTGVRYAWRNDPKGSIFDSKTKFPLLPFTLPLQK